jgi:hypothetical protein
LFRIIENKDPALIGERQPEKFFKKYIGLSPDCCFHLVIKDVWAFEFFEKYAFKKRKSEV